MVKGGLAESESQDYKCMALLDAQDSYSKTFRDGLRISIPIEPWVLPGTLSSETLIFLKKQTGGKGVRQVWVCMWNMNIFQAS